MSHSKFKELIALGLTRSGLFIFRVVIIVSKWGNMEWLMESKKRLQYGA
jgi:hypothetical protein